MHRYRLVISRALASLLMGLAATSARADDGWNPFEERDRQRAKQRQAEPAPEAPPPLPPMDGVSSRPWASPQQPGTYAAPSEPATPLRPWAASNEPATTIERPPISAPSTAGPLPPAAAPLTPIVPIERVERVDLSKPVLTADGSGVPHDYWSGVDMKAARELIAETSNPPHSAALHALWRRLWTGHAPAAAAGSDGGPSFEALRLEILFRSGLMADMGRMIQSAPGSGDDPVLVLLKARGQIALAERDAGCAGVKSAHRAQAQLPKPLKADLIILAAYCGASGRDPGAAGLAAQILRAERAEAPVALAALDAIAGKRKLAKGFQPPKELGLLDYRFLELAGWEPAPAILESAGPALLAVLATSAADPQLRILAAEAAVSVHALTPAGLADAFRAFPAPQSALLEPFSAGYEGPNQRALLFKALEAEPESLRKARLVRALLDEARRANVYTATAAMLSPQVAAVLPSPELAWFAETAIEVHLAAGKYDLLELWATPPRDERQAGHRHWLVLADIADPNWRGPRGASLNHAEQFAVRGRLPPELMHRLVTVLDALDYQIPIPLWEAASRTAQPATGHLPATGILSRLQEASKRKEIARTALLSMRALGPDSGASVHMIALGDTIKALKRAGLEADARRLGLEALFVAWPRSASN